MMWIFGRKIARNLKTNFLLANLRLVPDFHCVFLGIFELRVCTNRYYLRGSPSPSIPITLSFSVVIRAEEREERMTPGSNEFYN